jgi:hypothetical protein
MIPAARQMRDAAARLTLLAAGHEGALAGTVRLTASRIVAYHLLPPILADLRQKEPGIEVELVPSDSSENLLFREADIALRMYRPTQLDVVTDKRFFQGLPSPSAAALVAGFVWVMTEYAISGEDVRWLAVFIALFGGLTMVSNFKYYSGKEINLRKSVPFFVILLVVLAFVLVSTSPPEVLFGAFVLYGLSGYVYALMSLRRGRKHSDAAKPLQDDEK